jgi:hypothetical protein
MSKSNAEGRNDTFPLNRDLYGGWESMTEYERETAFLRHVIRFDNTNQCRELDEKIADVQREGRCVLRATWLLAFFAGLGLAGIAYAATLEPSVPEDNFRFMIQLLCVIELASLISLSVFICYLLACRAKLNEAREECRRVAMKLLQARLKAEG